MNKVGISPFVGKFFFVFWKLQEGNKNSNNVNLQKRDYSSRFSFDIEILD